MVTPRSKDEEERRTHRALGRLEQRVREVRHLRPFQLSEREDGRFACELSKPIHELTPDERRATAAALEKLAAAIRGTLDDADGSTG